MSLKSLLKPSRVAIMGASESNSLGGKTTKQFFESFSGHIEDVFLVNSSREMVFGRKCYKSVEEIPENFDLLVIATPQETVYDAICKAIPKKIGGVVVYASGFSETGRPEDIALEMKLKKLCKEHGIALLGPNCAGYINFVDNIYPFGFSFDKRERPGKVGVVSQSGQVCTSLLISPKSEFSYLISSGNSKITEIEEYLEFLIDDEDTGVVAAYMEGVTQPERFIGVLRKAALKKKPVVLLKSGRSSRAAEVAVSHTGSLTGSDKSFEAVFSKFGVIRADDIEELATICNVLALIPSMPKRNAVGVMCGSGGESATCADLCEMYGVNCPHFTPETISRLKDIMPGYATPNNPLDTTAPVVENQESFETALKIVTEDENIDLLVIGMPLFDRERNDTSVMVAAMEKVMAAQSKIPVIAVPNIETGRLPEMQKRLSRAGIPLMPPGKYAFPALKKILNYAQWLETLNCRTLEIAKPHPTENGSRTTFSEHDSKEMLRCFGVPVPKETVAYTPEQAGDYADSIGYPVVMKVDSADILHKSDVGGVKLGINFRNEAIAAFSEITDNARKHTPDAKVKGVLVQKMLPKGMEVIIGVNNDLQFGPMILLGLGGVFVEVFKDVALYPAPLNRQEALFMIASLKSSVLFHGYRGGSELDVDALADTLVSVSNFAVENRNELLEMDINPLFVYEKGFGVAAVDGLIVLKI